MTSDSHPHSNFRNLLANSNADNYSPANNLATAAENNTMNNNYANTNTNIHNNTNSIAAMLNQSQTSQQSQTHSGSQPQIPQPMQQQHQPIELPNNFNSTQQQQQHLHQSNLTPTHPMPMPMPIPAPASTAQFNDHHYSIPGNPLPSLQSFLASQLSLQPPLAQNNFSTTNAVIAPAASLGIPSASDSAGTVSAGAAPAAQLFPSPLSAAGQVQSPNQILNSPALQSILNEYSALLFANSQIPSQQLLIDSNSQNFLPQNISPIAAQMQSQTQQQMQQQRQFINNSMINPNTLNAMQQLSNPIQPANNLSSINAQIAQLIQSNPAILVNLLQQQQQQQQQQQTNGNFNTMEFNPTTLPNNNNFINNNYNNNNNNNNNNYNNNFPHLNINSNISDNLSLLQHSLTAIMNTNNTSHNQTMKNSFFNPHSQIANNSQAIRIGPNSAFQANSLRSVGSSMPPPLAIRFAAPAIVTSASVRHRVGVSCSNCKAAKTRCDLNRPCKRCSRTGRADNCCDSDHKKRGRKKRIPTTALQTGTIPTVNVSITKPAALSVPKPIMNLTTATPFIPAATTATTATAAVTPTSTPIPTPIQISIPIPITSNSEIPSLIQQQIQPNQINGNLEINHKTQLNQNINSDSNIISNDFNNNIIIDSVTPSSAIIKTNTDTNTNTNTSPTTVSLVNNSTVDTTSIVINEVNNGNLQISKNS